MKWYNEKKVVITGGAGFIGSHLAHALHKAGVRITILDNLSTGSIENIAALLPFIEFIEGDIRDKNACAKALRKAQHVFHCAAFISVPDSITNPDLCYEINNEGTRNLLEVSKKEKIISFVFSSSTAVYGPTDKLCHESMQPNPQSPYAISKVIGEQLCEEYSRYYSTVSLRYFNVYGERQSFQSSYAAVVASFRHNMLHNKPLIIYGTGLQTRDFIHVSKIVEANLFLGTQNYRGELFNIASGKSMNLFELIGELAYSLKPSSLSLIFKPARLGDVDHSRADCSKYQQATFENPSFFVELHNKSRGGEIGRHARFRF